jgi:hypothetical protein
MMTFDRNETIFGCMEMVCIVSGYTARFTVWSQLYPDKANKPRYGQLYIFDSAEAAAKRLENQSRLCCMAKVMQQLDKVLQQVNPHCESYKLMHRMN